jgi:quinohemoprotein ethanol dehydrogenase
MSYAIDGRQYVSVLVGYGGSAGAAGKLMNEGWKFGAKPRRLLTFAIGGKAVLPPSPPPDFVVHAVDDPAIKIKKQDAAAGQQFYMYCMVCHGRDLVSSGAPAPDLRESRIALDPDAFWNVLHNGALIEYGMPRFDMLSQQQAMDIWVYIRQGARDALAEQKSAKRAPSQKP